MSVMTTLTPTAADVNQILLEKTVRQRSMIVMKTLVRIMELARMELTPTRVPAPVALAEAAVRRELILVITITIRRI